MRNVSTEQQPSPSAPVDPSVDRHDRLDGPREWDRAARTSAPRPASWIPFVLEVVAKTEVGRARPTRTLEDTSPTTPLRLGYGYRRHRRHRIGVTRRKHCGWRLRIVGADRRGLTRESVNLDRHPLSLSLPPSIHPYRGEPAAQRPLLPSPSPQAYVTYLHRHRRSILSRDFRARDYARRNLSLEFVSRIGGRGRCADPGTHTHTHARAYATHARALPSSRQIENFVSFGRYTPAPLSKNVAGSSRAFSRSAQIGP